MSFFTNLTALLPFAKKRKAPEYFFALIIGKEKLTAALWTVDYGRLKILETQSDSYKEQDDIIKVTDRLLDAVVGESQVDPEKILFGVEDNWLVDENLKEDYLRLLRKLVKELEITPMAYVSQTSAMVHFLEKEEGVPVTAILVGIEETHIDVTVARASKIDGARQTKRSDDLGVDIERVLLTFTSVEVLPSKILVYSESIKDMEKIKTQLLGFSWMSKLSFLHFPKVEILEEGVETAGVCYAGASEIEPGVRYEKLEKSSRVKHISAIKEDVLAENTDKDEKKEQEERQEKEVEEKEDLGFMVGDVSERNEEEKKEEKYEEVADAQDTNLLPEDEQQEPSSEGVIDLRKEREPVLPPPTLNTGFSFKMIPARFSKLPLILLGMLVVLVLFVGAYVYLVKADIKIFVEPKVLENDTQVTADPKIKTVMEEEKKIPGEIVETDVSGSGSGNATGKKLVGEEAKGTVVVRNKTEGPVILAKGTKLSSQGLGFNLDVSVTIASRSGEDGTWGKATATVTASEIGADSNLASGSDLALSGYTSDKIIAKAEGNFSGGTSKEVTVVSPTDQEKLLAEVASQLKKNAQQKLQEKLPEKKVVEEALSETITRKSFNKNVGDQASSFALNLTAHYQGTAFDDKDLRTIVSKLVSTNIPADFSLDLQDAETSAEVSKLEKDGKVVFLARFKAKLVPKLDTEIVKQEIKGKLANNALEIIKGMDNVLGAEIKVTPFLPGPLNRLPVLAKNISIEVGFK